ncbi:MAG TPA: bifunctional phosphopantothenoylcysteine decarboxylase/phosphopantothenate--cysteine ligase CoaBC [Blastocatellia bacterium]|nr:bifunctional phosphopantothenoylcysteine decarboxylase/phosphopantothenate--cysteine ligase CoaBC [Blastocatellia bacterium]
MHREVKVALGVTGCIAAYKAVEILRGLQKRGASVQVVMTANAARFVTPLTFQAVSGAPVISAMFEPTDDPEIKHIAIAGSIDLLLVAPATANTLAKFANGIADDFLSTLYISTPARVLVAPAMNVEMWLHPATQENVHKLKERGVEFVDPGEGYLACRSVGPGRLAEPDDIVERAWNLITESKTPEPAPASNLAGERFLVTAGPTYEAIDPVRGITNRSSGKMGFAIAEAAQARGAEVILIAGPVSIQPPSGVKVVAVRSAAEMRAAVMRELDPASIVVMAAAVADYRPARIAGQKIKKESDSLVLELEKTEDILADICRRKGNRIVIGFAAETQDVTANARKKLVQKGADMIVANDVSQDGAGFDVETNQVMLITADSSDSLPMMTKLEAANRILDMAVSLRRTPAAVPHLP